jgi:hypothetical protein
LPKTATDGGEPVTSSGARVIPASKSAPRIALTSERELIARTGRK